MPNASLLFFAILVLLASSIVAAGPRKLFPSQFPRPWIVDVNVSSSRSPLRARTLLSKTPYSPRGISFNGGTVMNTGINVYVVFYGSWAQSHKNIIKGFINSLSSNNPVRRGTVSGWWATNSLYYDVGGKYLSTAIKLKGEYSPGYLRGKSLTDYQIVTLLKSAMNSRKLLSDSNGAYVFLPSPDVSVSFSDLYFCTDFCAFHSSFQVGPTSYKYVMVGHAGKCGACEKSTPNGVKGLDGAINMIANQLAEVATNPTGRGWWDRTTGAENAQKCYDNFGKTYKSRNGQKYTLVGANNAQYYVQSNWNPKKGLCDMFP